MKYLALLLLLFPTPSFAEKKPCFFNFDGWNNGDWMGCQEDSECMAVTGFAQGDEKAINRKYEERYKCFIINSSYLNLYSELPNAICKENKCIIEEQK